MTFNSSATLRVQVKDGTGTGSLVFSNSPGITLENGTGLPLETGVVGNLPPTNLDYGRGANASTVWHGDGKWRSPAGTPLQGSVHFFQEGSAPSGAGWSPLEQFSLLLPEGFVAYLYSP